MQSRPTFESSQSLASIVSIASSFGDVESSSNEQSSAEEMRLRKIQRHAIEMLIPNSKYRLSWEFFIFLIIWYNSIMTPMRLFILGNERTPSALVSADIALDVIFLIDTILHFFRPYIDKDTRRVVKSPRLIRSKYLRSFTFYTNTIACIPILKTPLAPLLDPETNIALSTNFNILRMIRILHFPDQFDELKQYLSRKDPVNESVFRMGVILFFTQLVMCIFGTVYFGWSSGRLEDVCPGTDNFAEMVMTSETWIAGDNVITDVMDIGVCESPQNDVCEECPHILFFLRSVYFVMQTLFTIGYGDTVVPSRFTVEVILACLFMIFGVFGYGLIIANMTSVLSNIDVVRMRFRHEMDSVNKLLSLRSVPETLRERVEMYFTYLFRSQNGMLDDVLFSHLPEQLSREISDSNIPYLEKVPFFNPEYRSRKLLSAVADAMIHRIHPPGSYILYEGEKQREMVIIKKGRAELYVRDTGQVVGALLEGDYIGDYQLLFDTVNQVGARCPGFTEVIVLTFDAFEKVMDHPLQQDIDFRSLGGNFRQSDDNGAVETIRLARIRMNKIATNISNMKKQPKSKKLMNMLEETEVKVRGIRIAPTSNLHVYWDIFGVLAVMYYAIACPIHFATFYRSAALSSGHHWAFFIQYAIDLAFVIDLYLRMNAYAYTTFDGGKNTVVVDRELIRQHYMTSAWFNIDCIAIVPLDLFALAFGHHTLFRISKLIRICQLSPFISRLRHNLDICMGVSVSESHVSGVNMFLSSILIIVWSSAGWNALRMNENVVKSVYWALTTLTTVGYGDVIPSNLNETLYAIIVGATGATFTAGIIAKVTSFFHDVDISEENIDHKANCVKRFMETNARPLENTARMKEYFEFIERDQDGINEELLLRKSFPGHLKTNILIHLTYSMVSSCDFFEGCEAGFLRRMMVSLEQQFFGAKTMVLSSSIPADGMFFIKKGAVDLLQECINGEMKELVSLETDGYFAEECLLQHWDKNPYLAMAVTDCELWHLSRSTFNRLIDDFPLVRIMLNKSGRSPRKEDARKTPLHRLASRKASMKLNQKAAFYIHPNNYFIQFWFGLVLLVTVYSVIALPFRLAFLENHDINMTWAFLDYSGDILLFADIVVRSCFLAYFDDNHLITSRKKIRLHYLQSGKMKWHILSIIPAELTIIYIPTFCPLWKLQVWSLFRLNKMLRLVEVKDLMHRVETSLAKIGVKVPKNAIRVGKLLMVILLSAHIVGCIFYMIASFDQYRYVGDRRQNWANDEGLFEGNLECPGSLPDLDLIFQRYVASLYWSMATLTTVGYGDIHANENSFFEIVFATLMLVIGTGIYTLVIALLEDIVSQLDVTSSLHKLRTDKVASYCQLEALPDTLKVKIDAHYENLWQLQRGVNGGKILSFFPGTFRSEMLLDMLSPLLHNAFFMKDCTADFIGHLMKYVTSELYLPDDTIFREGERCLNLLFLYKGNVDLLTTQNVKFKSVSDCILGEASFFGFEPHLCSAKAEDACEIFNLHIEDFTTCVHENQLNSQFAEYLKKNKKYILESKEAVTKMINNLKSSKMAKMHTAPIETPVPKGVVLPETIFRYIWDSLLLVQTMMLVFTIPYQISFLDTDIGLSLFMIDVGIDIFCSLDVYARLMKFAVMNDGSLIVEPSDFRSIYLKKHFGGDIVSIVPASIVGYVFGIRDRRYGLLRLFQFLRARHFGTYFSSLAETINTKSRTTISTAQMRVMQIFFIILFLCHWFACIYHLLGRLPTHSTWLTVDESMEADEVARYLRSFYWSLYTITTVGYGSIPVITNKERIFAMFVMAAGAVICDAGITAVLTSIISIRDQQSGTNSRRIQCFKSYTNSNTLDQHIHDRVLDYYKYIDNELKNIDESDILDDLSSTLRVEIQRHFCYEHLRHLDLFQTLTNGALNSVVSMVQPYLAICGEHLSMIGEQCKHLYILKRGEVFSIDCSGSENYLPFGAVIGHIATSASFEKRGFPTRVIKIDIHKAKGFKTKWGNPYIIFKIGSTIYRSSIKKTKSWQETIHIKIGNEVKEPLQISIKSWQSGQIHSEIGTAEISFADCQTGGHQQLKVLDTQGKTAGHLSMTLTLSDLDPYETTATYEKTTTALGYCHLYRVDCYKLQDLQTYLDVSQRKDIETRLPGPFLEKQVSLHGKDKIQKSWRRPSRPIPYVPHHSKDTNKTTLDNLNEENSIQDHNASCIRINKTTSTTKRSATVVPIGNEDDPEMGPVQHPKRITWGGSRTVRTKSLSTNNIAKGGDQSKLLEANDNSWDILAEVSSSYSIKTHVFMEWTDD